MMPIIKHELRQYNKNDGAILFQLYFAREDPHQQNKHWAYF